MHPLRRLVASGQARPVRRLPPSSRAEGDAAMNFHDECECYHDVLDQDDTSGPGSWEITIPSDDEVAP